MRIYLDNCCYNRPFDDQFQPKIRIETLAVSNIQNLIVQNKIELATSFMNHYENSNKPNEEQKIKVARFLKEYRNIHIGVEFAERLNDSIKKIMATGIKIKDATHVACAILAQCDYFLTVDERLLKYRTDEITLLNPVEFVNVMEVD